MLSLINRGKFINRTNSQHKINIQITHGSPLNTSCDSSTTFQIRILASLPPDVIALSRNRLSIPVIASL